MDLSEYLFLLEAETHILQIMLGVVFLGETAQEGFSLNFLSGEAVLKTVQQVNPIEESPYIASSFSVAVDPFRAVFSARSGKLASKLDAVHWGTRHPHQVMRHLCQSSASGRWMSQRSGRPVMRQDQIGSNHPRWTSQAATCTSSSLGDSTR